MILLTKAAFKIPIKMTYIKKKYNSYREQKESGGML